MNSAEADTIRTALEIELQGKSEPRVLLASDASMGTYADYSDPQDIPRSKQHIKKKLSISGYDITAALDDLFDKNRNPMRIGFPSAPSKGYVVGSMKNPPSGGLTKVTLSRPGIDSTTGLILIYIEFQRAGYIVGYKYLNNTLVKLGELEVWIA